jgi:exodeoxyribonuclease V alpha subunit
MSDAATDRQLGLSVTIDRVLYRSDDGRFAVTTATTERDGQSVTLVGDLGAVVVGESLSVRGRFEQHSQYGRRFRVDSFAPVTPRTSAGIERYLGSGLVPGVGPAVAARLVQRFGDKTLEVISTQSARLREVSGIGQKRASAIADAVRSRAAEAEALSYLQGLGLGPAISRRIRKHYGDDAVRVLRDDPYLVAEQVRGVGFATADSIGRSLGYAEDDSRRAAGAALHLVGRAADAGHVFLPREELAARAEDLSVPREPLLAAVDALCARGVLIEDAGDVYAPPLHHAELAVAASLRARALPRARPKGLEAALAKTSSAELSDEQRRAVEVSLDRGLMVLTGGPGTGKTTTVRALVAAHRALGRRVLLCAPTGRAAKRLSEAAGEPAYTLHRVLEYNPKALSFQRDRETPLDADLVLVDESSMLDLQLASGLLEAVREDATLVLVGDIDQLPPVAPGPVLRELIGSGIAHVVRLSQVFRQAQRSAIVRAAHAILHGRAPTPTPAGERGDGDLFVLRASDPEVIAGKLVDILSRVREAYGLDPKRDVQVLSPMRRGPLGTERLNQLLQRALNPAAAQADGSVPPGFHAGDKVMQLKNDYDREVWNGELGEVQHVDRTGLVADVGGRRVRYERDDLDALALAYACTVHKMQGSELPAVIVVLHTTHYVLLGRALIYTAITRARRLVVLLGDERALNRAIQNTAEQRVHCRLAERLRA